MNEGEEPPFFRRLFRDEMIVHLSKPLKLLSPIEFPMKRSPLKAFKFMKSKKADGKPDPGGEPKKRLYKILTSSHKASCAVEVPLSKLELVPDLAFVVCAKEWAVVRLPLDCSSLLVDVATKLATRILTQSGGRLLSLENGAIETCRVSAESERFWGAFPSDEGTANQMHE